MFCFCFCFSRDPIILNLPSAELKLTVFGSVRGRSRFNDTSPGRTLSPDPLYDSILYIERYTN